MGMLSFTLRLVGNDIIFRVIPIDTPIILLSSLAGEVGSNIRSCLYRLPQLENSVIFARLFGLIHGLGECEHNTIDALLQVSDWLVVGESGVRGHMKNGLVGSEGRGGGWGGFIYEQGLERRRRRNLPGTQPSRHM